MIEQTPIESFLAEKKLALAGASSKANKFGNMVYKELCNKGYELHITHPVASEINGVACSGSLADLSAEVGGLINVVPPAQTEKLVREAHSAGIMKIWMQQGSESPEAIQYCKEHEMEVVHGECILMFSQPRGLHKFHHWLWGIFGKLPKGHHN
ncbi:MAG: CoA-binding protein [Candidatus Marinimicrobia bacterium]|nr:CoA-binding protein [Candidatus Neomarinimicrobiota bacterium]MBT3576886.1 CoA-binding protein [Candidatus Neomarinimicrobiota bacterium]MBT3680213.1 CoA-binding protein [Candidatus Neomarinimicrobiota bacterium]MBT3951927.1 CoA-binding protein [Candidatus Neomarinimicrobiota bacterium]MBT4251808.1 CoA-binding protein [Candidatus Neomarinimicrobiota bacterium]